MKQLNHFIEKNKKQLLYQQQYGFRENRNTTHAVKHMLEEVSTALDIDKIPIGLCIDLRRAFDIIEHDQLFQKHKKYGI